MSRHFIRSSILAMGAVVAVVSMAIASDSRPIYISESIANSNRAVAAPVRLPPIEAIMWDSAVAGTPFFFTPIASVDLEKFQSAPAVTLGIGQPSGEKPSIGGWISFGGTSRGLTQ